MSVDEDELELEPDEFWRFVAGRVLGLILADMIAHPKGAAELMEAMGRG